MLTVGYIKTHERHRASVNAATGKPPAPLIDAAQDALDGHEPVSTEMLRLSDRFEGTTPEIRLLLEMRRPGAAPELYPVQPDEAMIRQALRRLE